MKREEVYKIIDSERDYQERRWNLGTRSGIPDSEKHPADWLNYIDYCLHKAKEADYNLDQESTMDNIRKIAALAVRAMELHKTGYRI